MGLKRDLELLKWSTDSKKGFGCSCYNSLALGPRAQKAINIGFLRSLGKIYE